jgi:hypothetical protein
MQCKNLLAVSNGSKRNKIPKEELVKYAKGILSAGGLEVKHSKTNN